MSYGSYMLTCIDGHLQHDSFVKINIFICFRYACVYVTKSVTMKHVLAKDLYFRMCT